MTVRVSPSQIATFSKDCQRKWAWSRVKRSPQNKFAAFGDRVHKLAEDWQLTRTPPDPTSAEGKCLLAGIHYTPMPGTAVVEHKFEHAHDGVLYIGRIDMLYGYEPGRMIVVSDHKTTGRLSNALTEEELASDPQRVIYGHYAATVFAVEYVTATWVYYQRDGKAARPVTVIGHRDSLQKRFDELHNRVTLRIVDARGKDPMELEPSYGHCHNAYGSKCPYLEDCRERATATENAERQMHAMFGGSK